MIEASPIAALAVVGVVVCAIFAYANYWIRHDYIQEIGIKEVGLDDDAPQT